MAAHAAQVAAKLDAQRPVGRAGSKLPHRVRGRGHVDEQDRAAVAVRGVLPDTRLDQAGQRGRRVLGRLRWPQRGQRRRPGRKLTESREPLADHPALLGKPGQPGQRRRGIEVAGRGGQPGHEDRAGRPVAQRVGDLVDRILRGVSGQNRADRVPGPDQSVRGPRRDGRQQPRPPGGQHLRPRRLAHGPPEERDPVAHPAALPHRLGPVVLGNRIALAGQRLQPRDVPVQPGGDLILVTAPGQHLHGHRPVVAQPVLAAPFRAPSVQPDVRLIENFTGHEILLRARRRPGG